MMNSLVPFDGDPVVALLFDLAMYTSVLDGILGPHAAWSRDDPRYTGAGKGADQWARLKLARQAPKSAGSSPLETGLQVILEAQNEPQCHCHWHTPFRNVHYC